MYYLPEYPPVRIRGVVTQHYRCTVVYSLWIRKEIHPADITTQIMVTDDYGNLVDTSYVPLITSLSQQSIH